MTDGKCHYGNLYLGKRHPLQDSNLEPTASSHYSFHCQIISVCALDYPFTLAFALGGNRLVSTPSPIGAWLGIASLKVSPNLVTYTYRVSPIRPNFIQKAVALSS